MKLFFWALVLITVLTGCRTAEVSNFDLEDSIYPFRTTKLARDLQVCPYGHRALKDIPILYGLPNFSGENGKLLEQKIRNHELTLGGCVVTPDSPKVDTTCLTCGFSYSQRDDSWFRSSTDPDSFNPAISRLLRTIEPDGVEDRYFAISIEHDQTVSETVSIDSSTQPDELKAYVISWLTRSGLQPKPESETASAVWSANEWSASGMNQAWYVSTRGRYNGKGSSLYFSNHLRPASRTAGQNSTSATPGS